MRANVTPFTFVSRTSSPIVTDPQPSFGETRMFFVAVPRPNPFSAGVEPDDEPNPLSVPGAIRICTPAEIWASVTDAMALPIAAQSQATSMTFPNWEPIGGVFAGQCVPFGPYDLTVATAVVASGTEAGSVAVRLVHGSVGSRGTCGAMNVGTMNAADASSVRREIRSVMCVLRVV